MNREEYRAECKKINYGMIYDWKVRYPRWHYLEGRVLREDTPTEVLEEARKLDKLEAWSWGVSHFFRNFVAPDELESWREFWKKAMKESKKRFDEIPKI